MLDERHIRARFADAVVSSDPFPHLVIEDVLAQNLYEAIDHDDPHPWRWLVAAVPQTARKRRSYVAGLRAVLPSTHPRDRANPVIDIITPSRSSPTLARLGYRWRRRYAEPISLVNALVEQALAPFAAKYLEQMIAAGMFTAPQAQQPLVHEWCRRLKGWTIKPHVHDLGQAIQWMLYFPLPGSTEDQGTIFYRLTKPKRIEGNKLRGGSIWFDEGEVEECFTVPYRPNTLVAFLNTPMSVHGTREIPGMVARRYFFVCNWWATMPDVRHIIVTANRFRTADETPTVNAPQKAAKSASAASRSEGLPVSN
jgi:hypothetical protein